MPDILRCLPSLPGARPLMCPTLAKMGAEKAREVASIFLEECFSGGTSGVSKLFLSSDVILPGI